MFHLRDDAESVRSTVEGRAKPSEIVAFGPSTMTSVRTNGPVWVEYLARDLEVPLQNFAEPGLDPAGELRRSCSDTRDSVCKL